MKTRKPGACIINLENKSKMMDKKQILEEIKRVTGNDSIKFPSQIQFSIKDGILNMHVNGKGVRDNMQTNGAAFEGWAICIKSCMPEVNNVLLSWDVPEYSIDVKEKNRQTKHYNRFLWRVSFFERHFDWFSICDTHLQVITSFWEEHSNLLINYPKTKSKEKVTENGQINKGEAKLERLLVKELRKTIPLTDHQLPVGLFDNEVKTENTCTPRGSSQIDLWQFDQNTLRIFELKDKDNNEVGIISELMFYANVINELVMGKIHYPQSIYSAKDIRNIKALHNAIINKSIKRIEAVFLVYQFHPLISMNQNSVLEIINKGMNDNGVFFSIMFVQDIIQK